MYRVGSFSKTNPLTPHRQQKDAEYRDRMKYVKARCDKFDNGDILNHVYYFRDLPTFKTSAYWRMIQFMCQEVDGRCNRGHFYSFFHGILPYLPDGQRVILSLNPVLPNIIICLVLSYGVYR